jgi:hypothetical protein
MKTTVEIPDAILAKLRRKAAAERTTLRALIQAALQQFLDPKKSPKPFKLKDGSVRGTGYAPGIREGDWNQIRDIIYEGRGA